MKTPPDAIAPDLLQRCRAISTKALAGRSKPARYSRTTELMHSVIQRLQRRFGNPVIQPPEGIGDPYIRRVAKNLISREQQRDKAEREKLQRYHRQRDTDLVADFFQPESDGEMDFYRENFSSLYNTAVERFVSGKTRYMARADFTQEDREKALSFFRARADSEHVSAIVKRANMPRQTVARWSVVCQWALKEQFRKAYQAHLQTTEQKLAVCRAAGQKPERS